MTFIDSRVSRTTNMAQDAEADVEPTRAQGSRAIDDPSGPENRSAQAIARCWGTPTNCSGSGGLKPQNSYQSIGKIENKK